MQDGLLLLYQQHDGNCSNKPFCVTTIFVITTVFVVTDKFVVTQKGFVVTLFVLRQKM
jgi:hypothetical protein